MKKILATGGMLTYMFLVNAGLASASQAPEINDYDQRGSFHQNVRHAKNLEAKLERLAAKLGLDPDELQRDIDSKKTIKEILKSHGITKQQLREVMGNKRSHKRS